MDATGRRSPPKNKKVHGNLANTHHPNKWRSSNDVPYNFDKKHKRSLFTEREEGQVPIYFVSRVLQGVELNYPALENLILALVHATRRLRRYFQSKCPSNKTKGKQQGKQTASLESTKLNNACKLYTDGASSFDGSRVGLMLINLEGKEYTYALRFEFKTMNNEAEYEALLAGLQIAMPTIREYLKKTKEALKGFDSYTIERIRRNQNKKAYALSKLASMTFEHLTKEVLVEVLSKKSIDDREVLQVKVKEGEKLDDSHP
nr:hypothetical protein [Tanacetum cinerariifolium]